MSAVETLALGLFLAGTVLFLAYAGDASRWGLDPLEDQAWGGFVMWAGAGAVEMLAALALVWRFLASRDAPMAAASLTLLRPRARMKRFGA